jgi:hypothetical protein
MNNNLVTIVALSVDTRFATLYLASGETMNIPQGDARLPRIVAQSKKELEAGFPVTVDITPIFVQRTEFADAEKGTKGVVKFFRVAKAFLKTLVNADSPEKIDESAAHISPLEIGIFPNQEKNNAATQAVDDPVAGSLVSTQAAADAAPAQEITDADTQTAVVDAAPLATQQNATTRQTAAPLTNDQKLDAAKARMLQLVGNGVGTEQPAFHAPLTEDETIVAVHEKSGAIIPDAHKLARQLRSAAKLQDYQGFEKFIERLSAIIDQRGHSVEDLMKFIEKGDLPIADDGCIVIYKRLSRRKGHLVDVHSGLIKQKVGSYVFMRPGLVDPNRRQDCSNGLHVASLSYLRQFSGDATVMAKVRPEDVFAVPQYNHNKMRVCGYHILVDLPDTLASLVNNGGSISSHPAGAELLANVLRGNHVGIWQHVEVGGDRGTNVTYTDLEARTADELPKALTPAETLDMQEALEAKAPVAPDIKATDLVPTAVITSIMSSSTEKKAEEPSSTKKPTQAEKAARLHRAWETSATWPQEVAAARELMDFKKQCRKGWDVLGLPGDTGDQLNKVLNAGAVPPKTKEPKRKAAAAVKSSDKKATKVAKRSQIVNKSVTPPTKNEGKAVITMTELAIQQLKEGLTNVQVAENTGLSKDQVYRIKKKLKA